MANATTELVAGATISETADGVIVAIGGEHVAVTADDVALAAIIDAAEMAKRDETNDAPPALSRLDRIKADAVEMAKRDAPPAAARKSKRKADDAPPDDAPPAAPALSPLEQIKADAAASAAAEALALHRIATAEKAIVAAYVGREKEERGWMVRIGATLSEYVSDYVAFHGVGNRKIAINTICGKIMMATGTDYAKDVSRCILAHHAANHFGRELFVALPVSAQKGFASLIVRADTPDGRGETYTIPAAIVTDAENLMAFALSEKCAEAIPAHVAVTVTRSESKSDGRKGRADKGGWKGGMMANGIDVYNICARLNAHATNPAKHPHPFAAPAVKAEAPAGAAALTSTAATTSTATDAVKATTTEGTITTATDTVVTTVITPTAPASPAAAIPAAPIVGAERGEQSATGERSVAEAPFIMFDVKPSVSAVMLADALLAISAPDMTATLLAFGKLDSVNAGMINPILAGMAEAGKSGILKALGLKIGVLLKDMKAAESK